MMLISVIVIAIVAAAYVFVPIFKGGVEELANDVEFSISTGHTVDGNRGGGGGGGGGGGRPNGGGGSN
jgi:uncharacterized membrane protein YgcG